jgi:hypothetical protein
MIREIRVIMECDRCDVECIMTSHSGSLTAADSQMRDAGWGESEDGEWVCPECWRKWDAERAAKAGAAGGAAGGSSAAGG